MQKERNSFIKTIYLLVAGVLTIPGFAFCWYSLRLSGIKKACSQMIVGEPYEKLRRIYLDCREGEVVQSQAVNEGEHKRCIIVI